ncbi:hypothetical protein D3C78_739990 [compost metagenome]
MPEGLPGHLLAAQAGKQHITRTPAEQLVAPVAQVALDPYHRFFAHGHQALLAAFAHHPQHPLAQVDLIQGQAHQLGDPQAAGIEDFEHGPVALTDRLAQVWRLQQRLDVLFRQGFGQRPPQLWHVDLQGRIDTNQFFPQQIAIEATHTREKACGRSRLVALIQAPGQVIENQLAPGIGQCHAVLLKPAIEQRQITAVRLAGIVGQAFFQPQGIEELVDQGML